MNMKIFQIGDACTGCGACANICPHNCLQIQPDKEGFFYPVFDSAECVECGLCEKACHVVTEKEHGNPDPEGFYLYHSNDSNLLSASSSGGGFSLFADWVLSQGGVVYGCRYNGETERLETFSTDQTSLASLRKSKYLESFTNNSFSEIRDQLKSGRHVLFCGTPCQVRGLKQYLEATRTSLDLLLTIDFACHGVPSNKYFKLFKQMFEGKNRKVVDVDFRHKDFSKADMMWHNMTLRLGFSDGSQRVYRRFSYYYYYYYELFLDNLFLRKSCYNCDIAIHSDADITLGDFWGIHKHRKELDDNKGMSFVCVNNKQYLPLWIELSQKGFSEKLPFSAIEYQYKDNRERRAKELVKRDEFVSQIEKVGYKKAVLNHYGRINVYKMLLKTYIKQIIGRK